MCQNVYNSLRPLHLVSKVLGYALFSVDDENFCAKFTKIDAVFTVFNVCMTFGLNFIYWNTMFSINFQDAEIVNNFFPTVAYINFVVLTCAKLWNFCHRHNFCQIFKLLQEIDDELKNFGIEMDYKKQRKCVVKILFLMNFLHVCQAIHFFVLQNISNMNIDNTAYLFASWGFVCCLVLVNQFITAVCAVKERYKGMNSIIK